MNWSTFDRRMEDPTEVAIKFVNNVMPLQPSEALARLEQAAPVMENLTLQQIARYLMAETLTLGMEPDQATTQNQPETIEKLKYEVKKILTHRQASVSFDKVPSPEKLYAYNLIYDRYLKYFTSFSLAKVAESIQVLTEIASDAKQLRETGPIDYLQQEITEIICNIWEQEADCWVALGKNEEACLVYEKTIKEAEANNLPQNTESCQTKWIEILFSRSGEFDIALGKLLTR